MQSMKVINIIKKEILVTNPDFYKSMTDLEVALEFKLVNKVSNVKSFSVDEIIESMDVTELEALSTTKLLAIQIALKKNNIEPSSNAMKIITSVFGSSSVTIASISVATSIMVCRCVELELPKVHVYDVTRARKL